MTIVETEEYFDKNCRLLSQMLLIIPYIIISYQITLLIWFVDKNVEFQRELKDFLNLVREMAVLYPVYRQVPGKRPEEGPLLQPP